MIGRSWMMIIGVLLVSSGCVSTVDWLRDSTADITFAQLQEAPDKHIGQTIIVGGKVLGAKRLKQETRIEILQLPLDSSYKPTRDLRQSQGRVIAARKTFLDPVTIPAGTFITVSGTVAGSLTMPIDEMDYLYPIVEIVRLHVWPAEEEEQTRLRPYPPIIPGPYWGPYWYPYWRPWPYW
ncbi:MAG: Slp family lipoprotein [Nitrospira sp.]|nr:Slp family lipoprotein [Nitrospira sp.]